MSRILAIARNTVREVVRERVVLVLALFGVAVVIASQVFSPLAMGEGRKVVTDFGLAGAAVLATMLAIFLGSSLLYKELDRRTIYAVMAKPIRRADFLFGKFAGLWATTSLLLAGMTGIVLAVVTVAYHDTPWVVLGALLLAIFELAVVTAIVVLFSSFTTPALTAFFAVATVVAGHFAEDLHYFGGQGGSAVVSGITEAVYWLLPHMALFNARGLVAHGIAVEPERLAFAFAYAALYAAAALTAAGAIFERREFR